MVAHSPVVLAAPGAAAPRPPRLAGLREDDPDAAAFAARLVHLARVTAPRTVLDDGGVCFTLRRAPGGGPPRAAGRSGRYGAVLALGTGLLSEPDQRAVLRGWTAADLAARSASDVTRAGASADLGDLAMAAWAGAEVPCEGAAQLPRLVLPALVAAASPTTVASAWSLTALVAAGRRDEAAQVARLLLAAAGPSGLWPHWLHAERTPRWRRHVGCFADQVYPVQALARYAAAYGSTEALAAAQRCADVVCRLQGSEGQWWWHYDTRTGTVVEGFPVYAVHQAGMAPMALMDLADAGGDGHGAAVRLGLRWLASPAETSVPLVDEQEAVVWRKVGRQEPLRRSVRAVRTATTALHARARVGVLDRVCPPGPVDHETRPYEAGWSLYAWLGGA